MKPEEHVAAGPAKPRALRPMMLWTAGILLVLGLAWFTTWFAGPTIRVHQYLDKHGNTAGLMESVVDLKSLGGQAAALRGTRIYLCLPDKITSRKSAAIELLGHCGPGAIPTLRRLLDNDDSCLADSAAWALGKIGRPAVPALLDAAKRCRLPQSRRNVLLGLFLARPLPEEALPTVVDALGDKDLQLLARETLAINQNLTNAPGLVRQLEQTLKSKNPLARANAALVIAEFAKIDTYARTLPTLKSMLADKNDRARASACWAIWRISERHEEVLPILLPLLASEDEETLQPAIDTLCDIGSPAKAAAPRLLETAQDAKHGTRIRASACRAIWRTTSKSEDVLPVLRNLLETGKEDDLFRAIQTLGEIGPPAKAALPALIEIAREAYSPYVREAAIKAQAKIRGEEPAP